MLQLAIHLFEIIMRRHSLFHVSYCIEQPLVFLVDLYGYLLLPIEILGSLGALERILGGPYDDQLKGNVHCVLSIYISRLCAENDLEDFYPDHPTVLGIAGYYRKINADYKEALKAKCRQYFL